MATICLDFFNPLSIFVGHFSVNQRFNLGRCDLPAKMSKKLKMPLLIAWPFVHLQWWPVSFCRRPILCTSFPFLLEIPCPRHLPVPFNWFHNCPSLVYVSLIPMSPPKMTNPPPLRHLLPSPHFSHSGLLFVFSKKPSHSFQAVRRSIL